MKQYNEIIKIGIIGMGYWGPNYVRIFNDLPESRTYCCCDIDGKKLKNIKNTTHGIKITNDYKEMLSDGDIDAIVVSTPASTHYKIVKECLESGKDVLVEKPFTLNSKEAEELINTAKKRQKILMVGHTFEYNPAIARIKQDIEKDSLGDIYYFHFTRTGLGPIRKDVNAMWDLAPHDISMLLYLLGEMPIRVIAKGQSYIQKNIEDVVFITLYFPEGILANIHVSWLEPYKIRSATIVGSKKMVVFDDIDKSETLKIFDKGIEKFEEKPFANYGEFQLSVRDGDIYIPKIDISEPLKNECKHFLECIKDGKEPLTNGEEGLKVIRILEAAQKSLVHNREYKEL